MEADKGVVRYKCVCVCWGENESCAEGVLEAGLRTVFSGLSILVTQTRF